jgi:hypothetical protein
MRGNKEVAARGMASVIHQIATQTVIANIDNAAGGMLGASRKKLRYKNNNGPKNILADFEIFMISIYKVFFQI